MGPWGPGVEDFGCNVGPNPPVRVDYIGNCRAVFSPNFCLLKCELGDGECTITLAVMTSLNGGWGIMGNGWGIGESPIGE